MSISTGPIIAGDRLQHSQKIAHPATGSSAQGKVLNPLAASARGGIPTTQAAKVTADTKESEAVKLSAEQLRQSLQDINKVLAGMSISVQFQIDPNYKEVIVKVVDQESDKVILQIPSVEVVRIAKAMDQMKGLLITQKV